MLARREVSSGDSSAKLKFYQGEGSYISATTELYERWLNKDML